MTTATKTITERATEIAERCSDAYSSDRYASWTAVAKKLLGEGYNDLEVEAIMRSKWTRWAADMSDRPYGKVPASAIVVYIVNDKTRRGDAAVRAEVAELVAQTF